MGGGSVKDLNSKSELDDAMKGGSEVILHFWASWCEASKQMDQIFSHLSTDFPKAHFFRVEAEEKPEISEEYSVSAVPYFVFIKDGKVVDTLEGADPSSLANKVAKVAGSVKASEPAAPASLGMAAAAFVLETVKDLAKENKSSKTENILSSGLTNELTNRLKQLVQSHPAMLFMKGTPEEPKCGFSQKVVGILNKENIKFGSFDILSDNDVREGLKKFSNWPTFPQLYCKGELLGGCDIVLEMDKSGELAKAFAENEITKKELSLEDRLKKLIGSSDVMVFIKGTPDAPRCGFSSKVVNALKEEGLIFGSFDILSDEEVRQGLKTFSNWPTFPQVYYKNEFIGGCDILMELKNNGELKSTLTE
jgi:Grx4 family monothiol glutaredoxin